MKSFLDRFKYAWSGIVFLLHEKNVLLHGLFGLLVLGMAVIFHLNTHEWLWILSSITLVIVAESINTCIEWIVDSISKEYTLQFKMIKDSAAGVVLIVSIFALVVGMIIFVPKVLGGIL